MNIEWDARHYTENFSFVHEYGVDVLKLIQGAGGLAIDLGCGNGALSRKLWEMGFRVLGVDASEEMLEIARNRYPELAFRQGNAVSFVPEEKADVVFSNAVLHWIDGNLQEQMLKNVAGWLKPGGQFVCEFGGKGCAERVHSALEQCFAEHGLSYRRVFYFPSIGMYAPLLEEAGFKVEYAVLFDRPTMQQGDDGLADWIRMFVKEPFRGVDTELAGTIIAQAVERLRETLYVDGKWYIDYVRIRFRARKM